MCDVFRAGRVRSAKTAGLGGVECGRAPHTGRVDPDPDAVERTPLSPSPRGLSRRRDSGSGPHTVRVLGVRSLVSVLGTPDDRIAAVAALQRGRIARRQLDAIGVNSSSVTWRVSRGLLALPFEVCLSSATAPRRACRGDRCCASVRDGAALSHWSAAALLGLWTPAPRQIDVVVDDPGANNPEVWVHRSRILESHDVGSARASRSPPRPGRCSTSPSPRPTASSRSRSTGGSWRRRGALACSRRAGPRRRPPRSRAPRGTAGPRTWRDHGHGVSS